jgi:hypothetical protein
MGKNGNSKAHDALLGVKTALELAEAVLRGIGIPGVEAIAAVPLRIIAWCEVGTSIRFTEYPELYLRGSSFQQVKANQESIERLSTSLKDVHESILSPLVLAKNQEGFNVPPTLTDRITAVIKCASPSPPSA